MCFALGAGPRTAATIVRRNAETLGGYLADALRLERMSRGELRRIVRLQGIEPLRVALAAGRGALVTGGHVGNWELLAAAMSDAGVPLSVVARRPTDSVLAARLERLRGVWGVETLWRPPRPGIAEGRAVLRALRSGRAVGVLIDQATDVAGEWVQFFGHPAWTPTGPASIAIRHSVPVVTARMVDDVDGRYTGIIEPVDMSCYSDAVEATEAWTSRVEQWVESAPHTWVWMHDRWNTFET